MFPGISPDSYGSRDQTGRGNHLAFLPRVLGAALRPRAGKLSSGLFLHFGQEMLNTPYFISAPDFLTVHFFTEFKLPEEILGR